MSSGCAAATPRAVLDWWFAGKWGDWAAMNAEEYIMERMRIWFGCSMTPQGPELLPQAERDLIDDSMAAFVPTIRAAGREELIDESWTTLEGKYAQLILIDQMSRNCFRGTPEAFANDEVGAKLARELFSAAYHTAWASPVPFTFIVTPGQHSEASSDHDMNAVISDYVTEKFPGFLSEMTRKACFEHKAVVDRFGRYPHRNAALGRESTAEELAWLADWDELPGWAKSQVPRPKA